MKHVILAMALLSALSLPARADDHNFGSGAGSGPIVSTNGGATGGMCFGIYCR